MKFNEALNILEKEECTSIRRKKWNSCVYIKIGYTVSAKELRVYSMNGVVAWIPNMIELINTDDWEVLT